MSFFQTRNLSIFVSVISACVFVAGAAGAITDTAFKYSRPKIGYQSIGAAGFAPASKAEPGGNWTTSSGLELTAIEGTACFTARVQLPHGSIMKKLQLYGRSQTGNNPFLQFFRRQVNTGTDSFIAELDTFGDSSNQYNAVPIELDSDVLVVDNARYWYALFVCVDASSGISGVRITYSYTDAGD
jgi:hypothetical protein